MTHPSVSLASAVAVTMLFAAPASSDVAISPVARAIACPAGMFCTPEAVDGSGRFIA